MPVDRLEGDVAAASHPDVDGEGRGEGHHAGEAGLDPAHRAAVAIEVPLHDARDGPRIGVVPQYSVNKPLSCTPYGASQMPLNVTRLCWSLPGYHAFSETSSGSVTGTSHL